MSRRTVNFTIPGITALDSKYLTDFNGLLQDSLGMLAAVERHQQGAALAGDSASQALQQSAYKRGGKPIRAR